jgi:peroxiredoxin
MLKILPLIFLSACTAAHMIKPEQWPKLSNFVLKNSQTSISLEETYREKPAVLIFWQKGCPCVKRYQKRIHKLYEKFGSKANFFYILSNSEDYQESLQEFSRRKEPFLLLKDEEAKLAKSLHIKGTPSAAVINKDGQVVFIGWIDNEKKPGEKGRIAYLQNALDELFSQKTISQKTSPMFGCPIR